MIIAFLTDVIRAIEHKTANDFEPRQNSIVSRQGEQSAPLVLAVANLQHTRRLVRLSLRN